MGLHVMRSLSPQPSALIDLECTKLWLVALASVVPVRDLYPCPVDERCLMELILGNVGKSRSLDSLQKRYGPTAPSTGRCGIE